MFVNEKYRFSRIKTFPNRMLWHINDLCNLTCVYCFFPYYDKENPVVGRYSPQQIYEAFKKTGRSWHLFISGGEPLLYPDFIDLINLLKPEHPIQISTNLFNKNVREFAERVSPENFIVINASLHILHHNSKSLNKFISNYHLYRSKGFDIIVSYVTYPPLFKRIKDDFLFLKNEGVEYVLPCTYNGIYEGQKYPGSYTPVQAKIIREIYQEPLELLVVMDRMHFFNKMCRAGKDYFFMDVKGEVFRCCTIWDSYGNLYEGTFKPGTSASPCTSHVCHDHCHGMMSLLEEPKPPEPEFLKEQFSNMREKYRELFSRFKSSFEPVLQP